MTRTTIQVVTHHPAQLISSLHDSSEKRPLRWIYLCWTMLSLVDEALTSSAVDTIVSGRRVSFDSSELNLAIFMVLWLR
jgi:hypothetical protein